MVFWFAMVPVKKKLNSSIPTPEDKNRTVGRLEVDGQFVVSKTDL